VAVVGTYVSQKRHLLHPQDAENQRTRKALTVTSSLILFTLMIEAICSSETSFLSRATRHHILESAFFKQYITLVLCKLGSRVGVVPKSVRTMSVSKHEI
jgi:hypothetical protein